MEGVRIWKLLIKEKVQRRLVEKHFGFQLTLFLQHPLPWNYLAYSFEENLHKSALFQASEQAQKCFESWIWTKFSSNLTPLILMVIDCCNWELFGVRTSQTWFDYARKPWKEISWWSYRTEEDGGWISLAFVDYFNEEDEILFWLRKFSTCMGNVLFTVAFDEYLEECFQKLPLVLQELSLHLVELLPQMKI